MSCRICGGSTGLVQGTHLSAQDIAALEHDRDVARISEVLCS